MEPLMRKSHRIGRSGVIFTLAVVSSVASSGGCATLAHRSSHAYPGKRLVEECENKGDVCPWLAADFALLLAGVVPGVIALGVDFGTGAWRHEHYGGSHF
jgi:hypothetical protein